MAEEKPGDEHVPQRCKRMDWRSPRPCREINKAATHCRNEGRDRTEEEAPPPVVIG